MHFSRTAQIIPPPKEQRPVSELIVEAYRNGHPIREIAIKAGVPRSRVMAVLVRTGEVNSLNAPGEERAIEHDRSKVGVSESAGA